MPLCLTVSSQPLCEEGCLCKCGSVYEPRACVGTREVSEGKCHIIVMLNRLGPECAYLSLSSRVEIKVIKN